MTDASQSQPVHFGKYLLDREVARGGMSRVYLARLRGPAGFEKKLVVKQVLPELARDPAFIELFVKEANTLVQMSHPGLVPVYELGVIDGVYFLAMERVQGATIAELLRDGPLRAPWVAKIGADIAEALRYAHERFQIVHRDVTPRNVIVDDAGHARLLDFGIAAPVELTGNGELFGSAGYMAPEQLRGEALGAESDVFSLGAVLHEAASGQPALPRVTSSATLPYPEPPAVAGLDAALQGLLSRMLQQARSERPADAAEVATTLRRWLAEHHPGGVERDLAARARAAHDAREAAPPVTQQPRGTHDGEGPTSGPVEVRSIATSPVLAELLKQATERIERPQVPPPRAAAPDDTLDQPEAHATLRRFIRDGVAVTFALLLALYLGRNHPLDAARDAYLNAPVKQPTAASAPSTKPLTVPAVAPPVAAPDEAPAPSTDTAAVGTAQPTAASAQGTERPAWLTVNAVPWAELRIDGRVLGTTPQRKLPVAPGKHTLTLACPPLGRTAKVPIQARSGQALQVLVNLQTEPAHVEVR